MDASDEGRGNGLDPEGVAGWLVEMAWEAWCLVDAPTIEAARSHYDRTATVEPVTYTEARRVGLGCIECGRKLSRVAQELHERRRF